MFEYGASDSQIADELNRSTYAISYRRAALGLLRESKKRSGERVLFNLHVTKEFRDRIKSFCAERGERAPGMIIELVMNAFLNQLGERK